jgi:hypothetical protein
MTLRAIAIVALTAFALAVWTPTISHAAPRALPGFHPAVFTADASGSHITSSRSTAHHVTKVRTTSTFARDARGRIKRNREATDAFKRSHPRPSTGKSRGACPGYVIDHRIALTRG